jgi:transposase
MVYQKNIMLKITLSSEDRKRLHKAKTRRDIPSERITAILLISEGMSAGKVGAILDLNPNTIRVYIKSYMKDSVNGLSRQFSTGRPSDKKLPLISFLKDCLQKSPSEYGWDKATWDSNSIIDSFEADSGSTVSHDTVTRAMKELGYSYKKPQKTTSIRAPSKDDKLKKVSEVISLIQNDLKTNEAEIYCCDESHFTNEPYLTRGYFKKRYEDQNSWSEETRNKKPVWVVKSKEWKVLLEKC